MRQELVERFLAECEVAGSLDADPQLNALRMAILIEDVFGVVLADEDISPAVVGETEALRSLLLQTPSGH